MPVETISRSGEPDFKLGEWWVRPQRNVLERGEEAAHVEARSMAVLVALARRAPEVVSKKRLLEEVWSDAPFVGEEVLSHAIWELRKALGDSAREPRYVQTIARKGYRLVAEVARAKGSPVPMAGVQINHYDLGEEVGRGAMGVVYKAIDRRLDRPVAIKFLAPELTRDTAALQRFEREARLAAGLDHPNLATVLEIGETTEGHRYLVTPLYLGGSLKERLAQGPIPIEEALRLTRQLAAGLGAAHRRDVVHRDVKPANLLLDEHGTLKIADFGIAKLLGATDLTRTGAALGTPAYKSPEQSRGEPVDHRSDLWSLGVVLFELLTGRRPFDGEYEQAVVHAILAGEPRPLEGADGRPIAEGLRRIVAKAMAKNPAERYQSAEEVVRDLDSLGEGGATVRPVRKARRGWWAIAGIGVAVAVLLWITFQNREYVPPRNAMDHLQQGQQVWLRGNTQDNLKEAAVHLERAVELAPSWAEPLALLAVFEADRFADAKSPADLTRARELIGRARAIDPETPLAWVAEARLLLLGSHYAEAERLAQKAMQREPECGAGKSCDLAYVWLGEALWQQGKREQALAILEEGTQVGGGRIRCRLKLAQLYRQSGQTSKEMYEYEQIIDWEPGQTSALNELGLLYLETNQYERAAGCFQPLYRKTGDWKTAVNLGHALYGQKNWQDAIDAYLLAEEGLHALDLVDPLPAISLGDVYLERGQKHEAEAWYIKAVERFDRLAEEAEPGLRLQGQRAVLLAKLGRFEEAVGAIEAILPRWQEYSDILIYAARIYALKKDRSKLFEIANRAIKEKKSPHRLTDDAAFIPYREDPEYLRLRVPSLPPRS